MKITIDRWSNNLDESVDSILIEADTLKEAVKQFEEFLRPHFKPVNLTCAACSKEKKRMITAVIEGKKLLFCSLECIDWFEAVLKSEKEKLITEDDTMDYFREGREPIYTWHDLD